MKIDWLFKRTKLVAHPTNVSTVVNEFDVRQMQDAFTCKRLVLSQQMSVLYIVRYFDFLYDAQHVSHGVKTVMLSL